MREQAAVLEAVADARLDLAELVPQPHDARTDVLPVALDDLPRLLREVLRHGDADLAQRAHRHRQNRLRVAGDAESRDAVAVEEGQHDAGLDVGCCRKNDDWIQTFLSFESSWLIRVFTNARRLRPPSAGRT